MPKLKAPAGASCFAFEGEEYEVKRGRVELPLKAVASALLHGFTEVIDDKAEDGAEVDKPSEPVPDTIKVPVVDQPPAAATPTQGKK
ncbi:hypothetical protein [Limnohabitans sp.]